MYCADARSTAVAGSFAPYWGGPSRTGCSQSLRRRLSRVPPPIAATRPTPGNYPAARVSICRLFAYRAGLAPAGSLIADIAPRLAGAPQTACQVRMTEPVGPVGWAMHERSRSMTSAHEFDCVDGAAGGLVSRRRSHLGPWAIAGSEIPIVARRAVTELPELGGWKARRHWRWLSHDDSGRDISGTRVTRRRVEVPGAAGDPPPGEPAVVAAIYPATTERFKRVRMHTVLF